jgi:hypothetical protein
LGFSNPISAIIILGVFISVLFTMPGVLENITSIQETSSEVTALENSITNTDVSIGNLDTRTNSIIVNFTLTNNSNEKIWDYENFDIIVTYDADLGGIESKETESMVFDANPTGGSIAPIIYDDVSSFNGNCSPCSFAHSITSSGTDRLLVVGVSPNGGQTVSSVDYGGKALTQVRSDDAGGAAHSSLWYLVNPPTGSNSVDVTLSAADDVVIGAMSFLGVDQTNPIDVHNGNTGLSANPLVTLTTTVDDDMIVDVVGTLVGPLTAGFAQMERWDLTQGTTNGGGSTRTAGASGLYTNSWFNSDGIRDWAISAAAIKPSPCNGLEVNEWTISKLTNNLQEPSILNKDEIAHICARLDNSVFAGGNVIVALSTDLGITVTSAITVP